MVSENIKKIRVEKNLTQKELADKLHVTAQAVSRWETGEVDVSISTLQEMCKIFDVSINELIEGKPLEKEVVEKTEYIVKESKPVLAVCERCNKPIYDSSDIFRIQHHSAGHSHRGHQYGGHTTTEVLCKSCNDARLKREAEESKRRREEIVRQGAVRRRRSFIWSGIITAVILLIVLSVVKGPDFTTGEKIGWSVFAVLFFPFISCLFLDNNFIMDMVAGVSSWSIRLPGLIFSLDLDGIIWLITVKLLFWILGFIVSALCFILAICLGVVVGAFVYPFALAKNIRHPEDTN